MFVPREATLLKRAILNEFHPAEVRRVFAKHADPEPVYAHWNLDYNAAQPLREWEDVPVGALDPDFLKPRPAPHLTKRQQLYVDRAVFNTITFPVAELDYWGIPTGD